MFNRKSSGRDDAGELVAIASFADHYDAVMLKGELESFGVFCVLLNENFGSLYPAMSFVGGDVKVMVREKDIERAREILMKREPLSDDAGQ